jgi:hypothetical protein
MRKAMDFFEEYDVYPYTSFKMVFVEDPVSVCLFDDLWRVEY